MAPQGVVIFAWHLYWDLHAYVSKIAYHSVSNRLDASCSERKSCGVAVETVEIQPIRLFRSAHFYSSSHNTVTVESNTERTKMVMRPRREVRCINHLSFPSSSCFPVVTASSVASGFARMLLMTTFDSEKRFELVYVRRNGRGPKENRK